jgi:hypothetical protein
MADINYWGLTGVKRSVTGITLTTATVDTLITAIATDEGLAADYYAWSLLSDPSKNSFTYGDSSTKLSAMGVVDGDTVICTPQQNETKQERQLRKLVIAEAKRKAFGDITKPYYRVNNTYDLTLLPDTYNGNVPGADDNANTGGLLEGRPWVNYAGIAFASNIWRTDYEGYFNDTPSFFATAALKAAPNDYNGTDTTIAESSLLNNTSIQYQGYFLATYTGTHTFYLSSDDGSWMWVGPTALTGFTTANALVKNGGLHGVVEVSATISLVAGTYYPIRIQFGNGPAGPGALTASYAHSGQAKTSTWTGKIFYNTATNGF